MTEAEWLACTDPQKMLAFLGSKASARKLRLFAVACCRRVWPLLVDDRTRQTVEAADRFVDGRVEEQELRRWACYQCWGGPASTPDETNTDQSQPTLRDAQFALAQEVGLGGDVGAVAAWVRWLVGHAYSSGWIRRSEQWFGNDAWWRAEAEAGTRMERAAQAVVLRDIFGSLPFHPIAVDPGWLTPSVVELACTIYEGRAFHQMPKLAYTLERAGCTDANILVHCREPSEHVRGCCVVDLILGKE